MYGRGGGGGRRRREHRERLGLWRELEGGGGEVVERSRKRERAMDGGNMGEMRGFYEKKGGVEDGARRSWGVLTEPFGRRPFDLDGRRGVEQNT